MRFTGVCCNWINCMRVNKAKQFWYLINEKGNEWVREAKERAKQKQKAPGLYVYTHTQISQTNEFTLKVTQTNGCVAGLRRCVYMCVAVSARVWVCLNEHNVIPANFMEQQIEDELMPKTAFCNIKL